MSELISQAEMRKALLKELILKLRDGETPEAINTQLKALLGSVPYDEVVEVEQELIRDGVPQEEILKLCDIHSAAMKGAMDNQKAKKLDPGHPVHTFLQENRALEWEVNTLKKMFDDVRAQSEEADASELAAEIRRHFHLLTDLDKHYRRKENLLFPYLEKHGIDGLPTVMWGKHDEVREHFKNVLTLLEEAGELNSSEAVVILDTVLQPVIDAISEMIFKEEIILFPMCMDTLSENEWYDIYSQSLEIGYCLYDPTDEWKPASIPDEAVQAPKETGRIQLPSGNFTLPEITTILNTIPFDLTFVDHEDTVRFFTQGKERIFDRNRAILGRKVQLCHPPSSVHSRIVSSDPLYWDMMIHDKREAGRHAERTPARIPSFGVLFLMLLICLLPVRGVLFASGACCTVSKGKSDSFTLTGVVSYAESHEMLEGQRYNLRQRAFVLKASVPLKYGLVLQGQVGSPVSRLYSHHHPTAEMRGTRGLIYGAGLGWAVPEKHDRFGAFLSLSFTRSRGVLDQIGRDEVDADFHIKEAQLIMLAEYSLSDRIDLYGGVRLYSGKNRLEKSGNLTLHGEREGNAAPLAGVRWNLSSAAGLVAEYGHGHAKIVSLGLIYELQ